MSVRDELHRLHDAYGELTPTLVVEAARPPGHPLHDRFEWDDARAGESHRLDQARALIRSVRIVFRDGQGQRRQVREFVNVNRTQGRTYAPVVEVAQDPLARKILLADMEREWRALRRRYGHLSEFMTMIMGDSVDETG